MGLLSRLFTRGESAAQRAEWIDSALRSATAQAETEYLRSVRTAQRSFEAAETPAWTDSWPTHAAPINEDLAKQLPTLRARSRAQARSNEWATNYLIKLDDNVLGEHGIRLQMRLTKRDGSPDKTNNDRIEAGWIQWGKAADVSGLCWRDAESLLLRNLAVDGEYLYRIRPGRGPYRWQIQILDPALLDVALHRDWQGRRVRMGVEIDDDGVPVAYWIRAARTGDAPSDIISVGRHVRIPADQIRHRFVRWEVGQLRGVPWLSAGARRLWLLKDFEESAAVASSNAAKRQGFFYSPTGEAPPTFASSIVSRVLDTAEAAGKVLSPEEIQAITAAAEKFSTAVPGQFDTLPQGYQFTPFESKWPEVSADGYVKQQVRGWTAARGMSYVSGGNDLEAVNYSSARVGIVEEREHYKTVQGLLKRWLHADIFAGALPYIVLNTPGLAGDRIAVFEAAATWLPRRWVGIDPVKEMQANDIALRLRLTSRRRLIMERSDDPDEIAGEIEEEEARYGSLDAENMPRPKDDEGDNGDSGKTGKAKFLE